MTMTCQELAGRIERLHPQASARDVARLCLLLTNLAGDLDQLADGGQLALAWHEIGMRLQAVTDQHAAMTQQLELLAKTDPAHYSLDEIQVLIRAIKVQNQVLQYYLGPR